MLDSNIVVQEFELKSRNQIHFQKGMNSLIPPSYGLKSISIKKGVFCIKYLTKVDTPLNKETESIQSNSTFSFELIFLEKAWSSLFPQLWVKYYP